jgi:hypothetical protein
MGYDGIGVYWKLLAHGLAVIIAVVVYFAGASAAPPLAFLQVSVSFCLQHDRETAFAKPVLAGLHVLVLH